MKCARLLVLGLLAGCSVSDAAPGQYREGRRGMERGSVPQLTPPLIDLEATGTRYAFLQYGQSPAGTSGSASALSTTQPYSNQRISSTILAALVETTNETVLSSTLNQVTSLRLAENDLIGFTRFATDTAIAVMRDPGDTIYDQAVTQGADMVTAAATARVTAMHFLQGESDVGVNTRAGYAADMATLRSNMESSLRANGSLESQGLAMFFWQTPGWTNYSATANDVILAQLDRHIDGGNRFFLTGPAYYLTFTDAVHANAASKQHYGQQAGKALEMLWEGMAWEPLRPRRIVQEGNFARAYFIVPCLRYPEGERCSASPPLAFDTTVVSNRTYLNTSLSDSIRYGFRYIDTNIQGVQPRMISAPAIAGTCAECAADEWRVDIEMSSPPRSGSSFGYADLPQTGTAIGCISHGLGAGCNAAGNLRDTDEITGWTGSYSLNNWSVAFQHPLTGGATPTNPPTIANATAMDIGGTDFWSTPDAAALDFTTEMSWFMIYRPNTQVANNIIMSHATSGASQAFIIRQGTSADDIIWQFGSTSNYKRCDACNLVTNTTYCLAGSYNGARTGGDRARIFLGRPGVSFSQPANSQIGTIPATMAADAAAFRVGFTSANADVILDEVAVWNTALTEGQLRAICYAYTGSQTADLENTTDLPVPLLWWRHDGDGSTTVTDAVAGTYNGTTSGAPSRVTAPSP